MTRATSPPTEKNQKNLVIVLACTSLHSTEGQGFPSLLATWIFKREDAYEWLQARRSLLPGADAMELAGLAILPDSLRRSISATLCGAKSPQSSKVDLHACSDPAFKAFTASSAICAIHASSYGPDKQAPERFKKAAELMDAQIKSSMPKALRVPDGFINEHESPEDALGAMIALSEQGALREQDGSRTGPHQISAKKPRL